MKIVFDSNVLVAAFVAEGGTCDEVFRKCARQHQIFSSKGIVAEVRRILTDKIRLPASRVEAAMDFLAASTVQMLPSAVPRTACVDPDDLLILGTALAAGAQIIVSGDGDLLRLGTYSGARILRPADMLRELADLSDSSPGGPPVGPSGGLMAAERGPRYGQRRKRKR